MQRVRGGIGVSREVDGGGSLSVIRDHSGVVDGARNADRLHGEGQLERIGFFVGKGLGQQAGGADLRCSDSPQCSAFALAGHSDCLRRAGDGVEAIDVERQLHLLGLLEVVVHDHRDGDFIPLAQEARRAHAHDDVLAHQHAVDR
jgi:hypothetical protein